MKCHSSANPRKNALIYYHGEDIPGCVSLRYLNTWSKPYCRIGSACRSVAATNVVTNDRASHGAVAPDDSGHDSHAVRCHGSGRDGVTRMQSGVMTAVKKIVEQ